MQSLAINERRVAAEKHLLSYRDVQMRKVKYWKIFALIAFCLAFSISLCSPVSAAAEDTARAEIPIREVVLSDGEHRYTVSIIVGGTSIEAGLDTGSTGLRILPDVVPVSAIQRSGHHTSYTYDSGTEFGGAIAEADVTIGVHGRAKFQQIDRVGCKADQSCPAEKVSAAQFGVQGSGLPNEGFKAILGINMGVDDTPNPLMQLGVKRWIVELPRPGDGKPGRLVLNPDSAEVANYTSFAIDHLFSDRTGGLHDAVMDCIVNQQSKRSYCGPTDLDTGAPNVVVTTQEPGNAWRQETPAAMVFYDKGKPILGAGFTVGNGAGAKMTIRAQPRISGSTVYLGILPYFAFSDLYDPHAKTVGLKAR